MHIGTPSQILEPSALSYAIFAEESRVSLYYSDLLFFGCNNPLAFNNTSKHSGTAFTVLGTDPGLICKNHTWPVLMVPVWFLCVNMWRHWRWSGVSLEHLSGCLGRYTAATKCFWTTWAETQRPLRLIRPILIPDTARNLFPLVIRKRARSSFNAIDFSRCPPQAPHSPSHIY